MKITMSETIDKIQLNTEEKVAKFMEDFSRLSNNYRNKEVADMMYFHFKRDHRTLQQSMFRIMLCIIENIAQDPEYHTDPRNADTLKVAKELVNGYVEKKCEEFSMENTDNIFVPSRGLAHI